MAVHNFNKTYTYVSAKYVDKSESDNTQIISSVKIRIDAVDQADSSKTITLEEERALNYHKWKSADSLNSSFIAVSSITNQNMIDWFNDGVSNEDMDGFLTWQLYGWAEVDPTQTTD